MKKGFATDIEKDTVENVNFRKVLSGKFSRAYVCLKPGEEIGAEARRRPVFPI